MRSQIQKVSVFQNYGFQKQGYGVATLHRPANVDAPEKAWEADGHARADLRPTAADLSGTPAH
jgi:hypothetical protein